jgi:hypothetical protein
MTNQIEDKPKNYFEILNAIDVSDKVEEKGNLSYLSWAWAWAELKKRHPTAKKQLFKNDKGWIYHTDGQTCWVEVSVTIEGVEECECLPIMDFKNKSIPLASVKSTDANTAIQRAYTKAIARHGLGLYIYAGEDLPEGKEKLEDKEQPKPKKNAFGLSPEGELANGDDMKQMFEEKAAKDFAQIKKELEGCETLTDLANVWKKWTKEINSFKKWDKSRYELLEECKNTMKDEFDDGLLTQY